MDDSRPFPIQQEYIGSRWGKKKSCTIPWWLAKEAYRYYSLLYGDSQSLERLEERFGFGRDELLGLLRRDVHNTTQAELERLLYAARGALVEAVTNEDGLDGEVSENLVRAIDKRLSLMCAKEVS